MWLIYATETVLTTQGCKVEVSDLYAMAFKASATAEDITGEVKDAEHFQYGEETMLAWKEGRLSADITEEHRKLSEAEVVIFQVISSLYFLDVSPKSQFPMYWFTVPAIMKGWMDRVLTLKYFTSRLTSVCFHFDDWRIASVGQINCFIYLSMNGILHYCGFQVLAPQIFWAPPHIPSEARESMLEAWRTRLQGLLGETPLTFTPSDSFDGGTAKGELMLFAVFQVFGLTSAKIRYI
uniref:Flavodoxin-like fold domain-containing protein n=1 Tax=Hucho hucho TaxID=62062 RepID=A0A4W5K6V8_9TELE